MKHIQPFCYQHLSKTHTSKGLHESTVRTIVGMKEKLKAQADKMTLLSSFSISTRHLDKSSRSMIKMEELLTLWLKDLESRNVLSSLYKIQEKARSLFKYVKETLPDLTEKEKEETFKVLFIFRCSKNWQKKS